MPQVISGTVAMVDTTAEEVLATEVTAAISFLVEPERQESCLIFEVKRTQLEILEGLGRKALDFEEISQNFRPKIFRFALASLRDRDAAETVAQDCLVRAFKARDSFRQDCSVQTWLMQIAVNLVRDQLRNRRLQFWKRVMKQGVDESWMACVSAEKSPEILASLKQQVKAIWLAAESLPERQKTVFLLRFVEDMNILDIAAATGMKEGTVKAHLFRALAAVRERLGSRQ